MRFLARSLAVLAAVALAAQPIAAQDVGILRDSETERLLKDMVNPLVEAAGMPKDAVDVVILNDPSINAQTAGGQVIYINSGLINAADNANEVQGVMAHELGHIVGGHSISIEQGFGKAPVFCREGGSIPVVSTFKEELGLPAVLFGVGLPDENAHAPNERLEVSNFHNGILASAILYDEIAATKS